MLLPSMPIRLLEVSPPWLSVSCLPTVLHHCHAVAVSLETTGISMTCCHRRPRGADSTGDTLRATRVMGDGCSHAGNG